ncbi:MAG: hypothetical protein KGN39_01700 [Betaproteobacteria bacterium]|nr:hypothetical protein [Betaproteobacteria bacterium]
MTRHQKALAFLLEQSTAWIYKSATHPNGHMSRFMILLHYVALRRRGELRQV